MVCVYTYMPCLDSLLTCTNIYYYVALKLISLVLLFFIAFCFIVIIIISVVDSKSCIREIVNCEY